MSALFEAYLEKLRDTPTGEQTEHTSRSALENLLNAFAAKGVNIKVQHEPRRVEGKGAPDYRISQNAMILGYVEVKALGANLDQVLKSHQIKKYLGLSQNIILTDYLHFILLGPKGVKLRASLAFATDLDSRSFRLKPENVKSVEDLLDQFFTQTPEGIGESAKLAMALASRSRILRDFLGEELVRQEKEHQQGKLWGLFGELKKQVFHDLSLKEFADAFAQMLAYGLFLAKLNAETKEVTLGNAKGFIPTSFQLIRELVDFLDELDKDEYVDIKWVIIEILAIVNGLDLAAIQTDLSFRQRKATSRKVPAKDEEEHRLFERDPFIYFYEDYLKAFDKDTRKGRGVYYTPPPIVNFIVRAVDDILKDKFEIADGLADHKRVQVLDFACGTGTFLLEVMNRIFENIGGPEKGKAAAVVREHILKNIYGFEYLIAPYTIAHLKLSQYLKDKGHPLQAKDRLQVFLTNTLEPIALQGNMLLPAITEEVKAAQGVKDKPILVIVGNPPYSGHSKNNSPVVKATIDAYKQVDGKPLGERNPKWLQDDYVKFIRFAQMKMDQVEEGVVGIITNHSWLDNPTFRGMRQSLMNSFEQIYVIDLHGNTKKKERALDGGKDENVFDIEQGVAISLFVKKKGLERGVWRGDLWGKRIEKYKAAMELGYANVSLAKPEVFTPYLTFANVNWSGWDEYVKGFLVADYISLPGEEFQIFGTGNVGLASGNDGVAIQFEGNEILEAVSLIKSGQQEHFKKRYGIEKFSTEWSWKNLTKDIVNNEGKLMSIAYRPFDNRVTYFTGISNGFLSRPRADLAKHYVGHNLGLITSRMTKGEDYAHVMITDKMSEAICLSQLTSNNGFSFPIRLNNEQNQTDDNFSKEFRTFLDAHYSHHYDPEEILGYIYAILHAPSYRRRYAEFLRIDFPRIPFCETKPQFDALAALGWELVQVHLLKKLPRLKLGDYHGKGSDGVEAVRYSPQEQAIHINASQHFAPVPEEVWNFHIGGYQVLDKWLKFRKGRELSLDDQIHVGRVADALAFTISQMKKIDEAWLAAFPGRT